MDQKIGPEKQMSCYKCGFQAVTSELLCPRCKRRLQTSRSIRIRGILLLACGGFLIAFMGYISLWMFNAFRNTNGLSARFNGTHEQMLMIIAICSLVLTFGGVSLVTGIYQAILGRRNRVFVWMIAALGVLLFLTANYFLWTDK